MDIVTAELLDAVLERCFESEAARRHSSASDMIARWHARCGSHTPDEVRAWVRAQLAALRDPQPAASQKGPSP